MQTIDPPKVVTNPKDKDLTVFGNLLGIEVEHYSFTVRFQFVVGKEENGKHIPSACLYTQARVFPIQYLNRFFAVNGKLAAEKKSNLAHRSEIDTFC